MADALWTVELSNRTRKQLKKLPDDIKELAGALLVLLEDGPIQLKRPHFGPLVNQEMTYHCHLKRGRPTYIACWRVSNKQEKEIEVFYVGTHEGAPY